MKSNQKITIEYVHFESFKELSNKDQLLMESAMKSASSAYAPYSKFQVGAALLLQNGEIVIGSNQENAAYPSGLCAERVAMFSASANFQDVEMDTIAIYTASEATIKKQISPCGSCRQVMCEYESKQKENIRVLLMNAGREVWVFNACKDLLPIAFDSIALKKQ